MDTIELRIKAYAKALLLIHSDGILASQCRNSLPLCAMALVRYEKQNLKTNSMPRMATPDMNVRSIPKQRYHNKEQQNGYHANMSTSKMMLTGEEKRAATAAKYFISQMVNARANSGNEKQKAVHQGGRYGHRTTMQQAIMSDSRFRSPFPPSA